MNAVVALLRANTRRFVNERSNLFFVVVLPLLIVFALGTMFSGGATDTRLGVADLGPSEAGAALLSSASQLDEVNIVRYSSAEALRDDVARKIVDVGLVTGAPAAAGEPATITWYSSTAGQGFRLRSVLEARAERLGLDAAATALISEQTGLDANAARAALDTAAATAPATPVTIGDAGRDATDDPETMSAVLAGGELTLFVFLSTLAGSQYLLLSRKLGVTRRTMAAPVRTSQVIAGEGLSRITVAAIQAVIVIGGCTLLFGVDWRSLPAVAVLCAAMALVGAGAAMIVGTLANNEQQAGALSIFGALVLAALGGSMQPLHFFPSTFRTVAFAVTPHAWMNDALWKILVDGQGLAAVWRSVAVLVAAGIVLLAIAARLMRTRLR